MADPVDELVDDLDRDCMYVCIIIIPRKAAVGAKGLWIPQKMCRTNPLRTDLPWRPSSGLLVSILLSVLTCIACGKFGVRAGGSL